MFFNIKSPYLPSLHLSIIPLHFQIISQEQIQDIRHAHQASTKVVHAQYLKKNSGDILFLTMMMKEDVRVARGRQNEKEDEDNGKEVVGECVSGCTLMY